MRQPTSADLTPCEENPVALRIIIGLALTVVAAVFAGRRLCSLLRCSGSGSC